MGVIHEVLERLGLGTPLPDWPKDDRHRTAELLCGFPPVLVGIRPSPLFHFWRTFRRRCTVSPFLPPAETQQGVYPQRTGADRGVGDKTVQTLLRHFRTVEKGPCGQHPKNFRRWSGAAKGEKNQGLSKNSRIFLKSYENHLSLPPDSPCNARGNARMAESVDALVSNTNDNNVVPVRPRLRVPK